MRVFKVICYFKEREKDKNLYFFFFFEYLSKFKKYENLFCKIKCFVIYID